MAIAMLKITTMHEIGLYNKKNNVRYNIIFKL